jgi:hypothetical protein
MSICYVCGFHNVRETREALANLFHDLINDKLNEYRKKVSLGTSTRSRVGTAEHGDHGSPHGASFAQAYVTSMSFHLCK